MRYLVPFHPQLHAHFFTDILILGGGLAGLRAALAVDPSQRVLLLCKGGLFDSNSSNAQGGVATVWDAADSLAEHVEDTLIAGGELCDREVVEHVVSRGPAEIRRMIAYNAEFDRDGDRYSLSREGGHRRDRILHARGDATGHELIRALVAEVRKRPNIRIWENTFAIDLLGDAGACRGAIVFWKKREDKELIWAKQTILAGGGVGQIYRETTNPFVATGDGIAMAYRAGAEIRDMEFQQFHPTVLYIAGSSRHLITEAMRGEGAYLVDRKGCRFMFDYDERGELAPRDIVSKAITAQMIATESPNVFLDLTHKEPDWIIRRFPGIAALCKSFGIDIAHDRIPVRPGAHYSMGGVTVDLEGRTTLPGLWAAGEVSSTGLHGANRLASNSLLEALVFGESTGRSASKVALMMGNGYDVRPIENPPIPDPEDFESEALHRAGYDLAPALARSLDQELNLNDIRNALKSLLWRSGGVVRNGERLAEALDDVRLWSALVNRRQHVDPEAWELQNMLLVARLVLEGAFERRESRGAHTREDFPQTDAVCRHTLKRRREGPS